MAKYSIAMQHIRMEVKEKEVLHQINMKVEEGEIFGLLGPSGAGKTTLIKILTGQLVQTGGTAKILGEDTKKLSMETLQKTGMVLDNTGLYQRLSCYANLELFAKIYGVPLERIEKVLRKVSLTDAKKCPVMKLSKGMKQRLVLARAILHEPKLLFLDEPTSGLDPSTASGIHDLILEQKAKGVSILLTTHNMEEAAKLCDHVALLNQGSIVEYGTPKEICLRYNNQNKIKILLKNGEQVSFPNGSSASKQIAEYLAGEMITTIHSTEPNLESVFMELTGRGLD